jgi:hypothetical protein
MKLLEARVKARNRVNKAARELHKKLAEAFKPLIGQKVIKANGSFLTKYEQIIKQIVSSSDVQVTRWPTDGHLAWNLYAWPEQTNHRYEEVRIYVGKLIGQVLVGVRDPEDDLRCDYTVGEVLALRECYFEAKEVCVRALSALDQFGEHDY